MYLEILYLFNLIGVALILGSLVFEYYDNDSLSKISKFFIGFSLSPFFISIVVTVAGLIFKKVHQSWFFVIPSIIIVAFFSLKGRFIIKNVYEEFRNEWNALPIIKKLILIPMLEFVLIVLAVSIKLSMQYPIIVPHDAGVYMNEALNFVQQRKIPSYDNKSLESEPGHPHSFLYSGYITYGLFATSELPFGHPNDRVAQFGTRFIFIFLFTAVACLINNIKKGKTFFVFPFLLLFLSNPVYNITTYFLDSISRDPFRIITIILLITVLISLLKKNRVNKKDQALLTLITVFGIWAHTINIVILGLVYLTWGVLALQLKKSKEDIFLVVFSSILGFLIGGLHYLKSYLDAGRLMGNGFYYYSYVDTPLWNAFINSNRYVQRISLTIPNKLVKLLLLDNFIGVLVFPLSFYVIFRSFKKDKSLPIDLLFLSLLVLILLVPYTGIFDVGKVNLSEMFLFNNRYKTHWILISSILITSFFTYSVFDNKYGKYFLMILIFSLSYFGTLSIFYEHFQKLPPDYMKTKKYNLYSVFVNKPKNKTVLLDNLGADYYINQNTVFIYEQKAQPILKAKIYEDVEASLNTLGIDYILLERPAKDWWDKLTFYDYIQENAEKIEEKGSKKYKYELYKLK